MHDARKPARLLAYKQAREHGKRVPAIALLSQKGGAGKTTSLFTWLLLPGTASSSTRISRNQLPVGGRSERGNFRSW